MTEAVDQKTNKVVARTSTEPGAEASLLTAYRDRLQRELLEVENRLADALVRGRDGQTVGL